MSCDGNSPIEALDAPCLRSAVDEGLETRGSSIGMLLCPRGERSVQSPVYWTLSGGYMLFDLPGSGQGE
jgi:hypothetical protein